MSTKTSKGNRWLRQAANAAARSKDTFVGAYYQRLRGRMGHKKALVALAHRILIIIYHLLKEHQSYREMTDQFEVVIIGGGQEGLTLSYYLTQQGRSHLVLEQGRVGETWRGGRWIRSPSTHRTG